MKQFFTFFLLVTSFSAMSQNDYDSLNKPIPKDWYKESSVILYHKVSYNVVDDSYYNNRYKIFFKNDLVIRLNDKASIEQYNSMEFPKDVELEIEVINKDGSTIEVTYGNKDYWNNHNADKDKSFTEFYKLVENSKNEKRKYAIPDLDTGDLIVIKTRFVTEKFYKLSNFKTFKNLSIFCLFIYPLSPFVPRLIKGSFNEKYEDSYFEYLNLDYVINNKENTLYKKIEIKVSEELNVNYNVYNGCKTFEKKYDPDTYSNVYWMSDSFLTKTKNEIWSSNFYQNPYFSFKTYYINRKSKARDKEIFKSKESDIKTFSIKQIKKFYKKNERFLYLNNKKKIRSFHKSNPKAKSILDPKKYVFEYLKYKKNQNLNNFIFDNVKDPYRITFYSKDLVFELVSIAKRFLLPYNVYLIVPKEFGKLEDISSVDKFRYAIEINFKSGPITFYGSEINSLGLTKPAYLSGAEAYKIKGAHYSKIQGINISKVSFPELTEIENGTITDISIDLNSDTLNTKIKRTTAYFGSNKNSLQYSQNFIFYYIDSIINSAKEFNEEFLFVDSRIYDKEFSDKDLYSENERLINSFRANVNEFFKQTSLEKLSQEFLVSKMDTSYLDFTNYFNNPLNPISHIEIFDIDGFVIKSSSRMIINLGSLIESQVELVDEEDRNRSSAIIQPNLRKFENKIRIKIPKGYKPIGLESFKFNIDNEVGSFISTVNFSSDYIEISIIKSYKKIFTEKDSWPLYLEFLDAANDFRYKKLILERN